VRSADEVLDEASDECGREEGVALDHGANGVDQLFARGVLEKEAARSCPHGLVEVLVEVERREHEHLGGVIVPEQTAHGLDPVEAGHSDVHQNHVRSHGAGNLDRLSAVGRLADHGDVFLSLEDGVEAGTDERLVVGDEHADHDWRGRLARTE